MKEDYNYINVCNKINSALTAFDAYDGDPDYDNVAEFYREICDIAENMQKKIKEAFVVF